MVRQDIRYALRTLRRNPAFSAVAVISLALGIGANTAIFSLINTLMFRALPVREPGELVEMFHKLRGEPDPRGNGFALRDWAYMRDHNHVFANLFAGSEALLRVRGDAFERERVESQYVDGNFFPGLGLRAATGRLLGPDDDHPGVRSPVAVISWAWWNGTFHSDPGIVGRRIVVEDIPVTIVGVAPRDFFGWVSGATHDLWLPLAMAPVRAGNGPQVQMVGRLKHGVSVAQALAEMAVLDRQVMEEEAKTHENPYLHKVTMQMEPAGAGLAVFRDMYAKPLLLLMSVVILLLLTAITNVASLLLARAAAREREMAIRVSLGAGRLRLVRQVLTESMLLSLMGSLPGIGLAYLGTAALVRIVASGRDRIRLHVEPDAHVLVFAVAAALVAGLLFGLAPAVRALASGPGSSLRTTGKSAESRFGRMFGQSLVIAQVAFSVVLLSAASLFLAHLSNLDHLDLGFTRENVLLVTLDAAHSGYRGEQLSRGYRELLRRLEAIPGVRSATLSAVTPVSGAGMARSATVEGYQAKQGEVRYIQLNAVAPRYFETFGTPLLAGRDFTPQDQGQHVAIVDQTLARYYFGNSNNASPLGMHLKFDGDDHSYEIVGLVRDTKYRDLLEPAWRTAYLNAFEQNRPGSQFALRTSVDPASAVSAVRRAVGDVLKTVPIVKITTMKDQIEASIVTERLIALLAGLFGALGGLLAAVGLYGLLAYTVARRTNEIGIRMALGATPPGVIRMILTGALGMVFAGLTVGIPFAFWGRRFATSAVAVLSPGSVAPIVAGTIGMIAIALVAAWLPARRAARVDPMQALHYE
jgi:putative ABC transport system permease protein